MREINLCSDAWKIYDEWIKSGAEKFSAKHFELISHRNSCERCTNPSEEYNEQTEENS